MLVIDQCAVFAIHLRTAEIHDELTAGRALDSDFCAGATLAT